MKFVRMVIFIVLSSLVLSSMVRAEVKTYEGTGEYVMSDFETPDIAKQRAKVRAEQACVEQAGVYVKSYTRTVNSIVAEDEVEAISNNIINVIEVNYIVTPIGEVGGGFRVVATIKATVDSNRIDAWMEREKIKNYELISEN